jgi:hypothetical protein
LEEKAVRKLIGLVKKQGILPGTDQRGIILLVVLMVMIVLGLLGSALLTMSFTEDQISRNDQEVVQALYVAEAGVQSTLNQLNLNPAAASPQTGTIGPGQFSATWAAAAPPANQRRIDAYGYVPTQASPRAVKRISVLINRTGSLFPGGLFGKASVDVSGGSGTDSYDSALGPYGGANVGSNGDIGSNGNIVLSKITTIINGDASAGGTISYGIPPATVTGTASTGVPAQEVPDIPCPAGFSPAADIPAGAGITYNSVTGDLEVSKVNLTLTAPGPYKFHNLIMSGGATLTITVGGHVDIYVSAQYDASGGSLVNTSANPTNLTLYGCGTDTSDWESSGGGTSHMAIYAPNHRFEVSGTGTYYGAIVAGDLILTGGSKMHYDEALGRMAGPVGKYSVLAGTWTELSP